MALLKWSDWYELGIPSIDAQHETLFDTLNGLHDAIESGAGATTVTGTLDFLVAYAVTHFQDEEAQMALFRYPGLAEHQAEHELLLTQVKDLQGSFGTEPTPHQANALAEFLISWVTQHILGMDRKFADALKASGR